MYIIARNLIKHKKILEFTSIYEDYLRQDQPDKFWLVNTNKLVRFYNGVDGLKTGYTEESGYCLTATAMRDNMRLIAIVFGEPDSTMRSSEISKMLDYGYNVYETKNLISINTDLGKIKVIKGKIKEVAIKPIEDVNLLYKKGETMKNVTYNIKIDKKEAPLKKGEIIGNINVVENDSIIRSIGVTVEEDVPKANIFQLYITYLLDVVKGL
jgi:D-alanyl-D-alanine carboxypeptidase (penicillin-binding protein 5/6)